MFPVRGHVSFVSRITKSLLLPSERTTRAPTSFTSQHQEGGPYNCRTDSDRQVTSHKRSILQCKSGLLRLRAFAEMHHSWGLAAKFLSPAISSIISPISGLISIVIDFYPITIRILKIDLADSIRPQLYFFFSGPIAIFNPQAIQVFHKDRQ